MSFSHLERKIKKFQSTFLEETANPEGPRMGHSTVRAPSRTDAEELSHSLARKKTLLSHFWGGEGMEVAEKKRGKKLLYMVGLKKKFPAYFNIISRRDLARKKSPILAEHERLGTPSTAPAGHDYPHTYPRNRKNPLLPQDSSPEISCLCDVMDNNDLFRGNK